VPPASCAPAPAVSCTAPLGTLRLGCEAGVGSPKALRLRPHIALYTAGHQQARPLGEARARAAVARPVPGRGHKRRPQGRSHATILVFTATWQRGLAGDEDRGLRGLLRRASSKPPGTSLRADQQPAGRADRTLWRGSPHQPAAHAAGYTPAESGLLEVRENPDAARRAAASSRSAPITDVRTPGPSTRGVRRLPSCEPHGARVRRWSPGQAIRGRLRHC
jgi:hypothetical protein